MTTLASNNPKKPPRTLHRDQRPAFIDSTAVYLRAIYEMVEEDGVGPNRISISRRIGISRSGVGQLVDRMAHEGLVDVSGSKTVHLTDSGRAAAVAIVRKHRLAERLLADIVGLEWELCHAEAARWQHVLGDVVERRLVRLLDDPTTSPYGAPIPGLHELDQGLKPRGPSATETAVPLADLHGGGWRGGRVQRILETLQGDGDSLHRLRVSGVVPGAAVEVGPTGDDGTIPVESQVGRVELDESTCRAIVVAVPRPPGPRAATDQVNHRGGSRSSVRPAGRGKTT